MKPIKILQFGEGNFLRAFVDYFIQIYNEQTGANIGVGIVKPIPYGNLDRFVLQNNRYHVVLRGKGVSRTTAVDCVEKAVEYTEDEEMFLLPELQFVVSNTTEAGIVYTKDADTFPRKITKMLYQRFIHKLNGLIFLPVELIEKNGEKLKSCVLRYADDLGLSGDFKAYIQNDNIFCNTLVDRIVTGFVAEQGELLNDQLVTVAEPFGLWVIESDRTAQVQRALPLDSIGLPVIFSDNMTPYRERKVRILNGAHTALVPHAMLKGFRTVGQAVADPEMRSYLKTIVYDEIIPTLSLPKSQLTDYADSVFDRFENPYIEHQLSSIALNSFSKFQVRVMPSILQYKRLFGCYPKTLMTAFDSFCAFYQTEMVNDDPEMVKFMRGSTRDEVFEKLCE